MAMGKWSTPVRMALLEGPGGAGAGDVGVGKSTNTRAEHKVVDGGPTEVSAGVMDLHNSNGGVPRSEGVPGPEIYLFEKR